jgi:hypothetical protein
MHRCFLPGIVAIALLSGADPCRAEGLWGAYSSSCDQCDTGGGRCGHHGHHHLEGRDRHYNCGCNGSYKFPVPPLYTYHWPGMHSAQLMTDYHSPYRFPPLKPYVDETPVVVDPVSEGANLPRMRPTVRSASYSSR